jgi:hypothetical protein
MKKTGMLAILCGFAGLVLWGCAVPLGEDFTIPRDTKETRTYIVDYNLQNYIPVPVKDEPAVKLVSRRADLDATVTWKDENGNELPTLGSFEGNKVYKAEIRLTPRAGYLFNPSINFAYHPGKVEEQNDSRGNPTRIVTVTYNNSDDGKIIYITDYNLGNYVPFPITGQDPVRLIDVEGVTGTASWKIADVPLDPAAQFETGVIYTADIELEALPGYRFNPKRNFEYSAGMVTTQPDPNGDLQTRTLSTVEYQTPKTPVDFLNLSAFITVPEEGEQPGRLGFSAPADAPTQYTTGKVEWDPVHSLFQGGYNYTATVVLIAEPGYAFAKANNFYHNGALSVISKNNTGNSVTVAVFFPADNVDIGVEGGY